MGQTFPLDRAADALHAIGDRRATGNLMLKVR
jgi:hypothetical protein